MRTPTTLPTLLTAVALAVPAIAGADPTTFWADFGAAPIPVGVPTVVTMASGTQLTVTVQTGGSQGVNGADLDTLGQAATGLDYEDLLTLAIFNGGGSGTVPTTVTFSGIQTGAEHRRGLLMVGAVNGQSSPLTVTSSVPGRVATWTVVGSPFDFGPNNAHPITWHAGSGTFMTDALVGIDSRCLVIDTGDLTTDGTITISLNQHLSDGIVFSIGEELVTALDVPTRAGLADVALSAPRPNPARHEATFEFSLSSRTPVHLEAFDLGGRRLATLAEGTMDAGSHLVRWNLRDTAGEPIPPGLAFVRLATPAGVRTRRIVVTP